MFNFLNTFGLPVKYALIGAISVVAGIWLAGILGYTTSLGYPAAAAAGAVGGAFGGWMRQRRGRQS